MSIKPSSTGGVIRQIGTRTIHLAQRGAYSGRVAEEGVELVVYGAQKRGRGRPRKDEGKTYDFSAFVSNVKVPVWKGKSFIHVAESEA